MATLAFALYLFFIASWFVHLAARVPALGAIRFDLLLVAMIGALSILNRPPSHGRISTLLAILLGYIALSTPFVEWPGSVVRNGLQTFVQALVFYYFTTWLVTSERRLKLVVAVFVLCQVFRVLEPVYLHQTEGYWGSSARMADFEDLERLSGAPFDVVNPNGLAFIILTVFCFIHYLWPRSFTGTIAYASVLPISLYALVLTGSRSGVVGLAAAFGAVFLRSRHKLVLAVAAAAVAAFAVPRLSADLADRYLSVVSSNTKNAETVDFRVSGVEGDIRVALRRPIFGHGLGTSREANANFRGVDQPSHNLYTEILQELGIGGLVIFTLIIGATVKNLRTAIRGIRARAADDSYQMALANSLSVWMALNLIFSLASYGLSNYTWFFMAGLSEALIRLSVGDPVEVLKVEAPRPRPRIHAVALKPSVLKHARRNRPAWPEGERNAAGCVTQVSPAWRPVSSRQTG